MSLKIYDFRTDVANVLVTLQIRCRFLNIEVGQFNIGYTHDLGHEIFLVLQGQDEFKIDDQKGMVGPGQLCIDMLDQFHTVRNIDNDESRAYRNEPEVDWERSFARELCHFHESVVDGVPNRTSLAEARHEVELIISCYQACSSGSFAC